ncbi:hypothetical protein [Marinomonas sp. GJ51-6]|uniref:hypothetical protein n=1 Tax=Marinomonas sp. GJ51-6 TaxID=2992802 RepID=UPI002934F49F|nr:hypothetical protein [Marinomonas sp. GJ51-6]WOD08273.1 hypothetical protein ONZ50_03845 [Marinomonas sp. GJ51-6]
MSSGLTPTEKVLSGKESSEKTVSKLNSAPPKHGGDLAYWQRKVGNQALNWLDLSSACNREPWPFRLSSRSIGCLYQIKPLC